MSDSVIDEMALMPLADTSAASQVYSWVRNAIATGRLVPEERYSIYWLAEEVGFSRTPVREAILKLAQLGVIEIERNRGFIVRRLNVEDVRANYETRLLFEVPGARAAALREDHREFAEELTTLLKRMDDLLVDRNIAEQLELDRILHSEILNSGQNARVSAFATSLRDASVQTWDIYDHLHPEHHKSTRSNQQEHYDIVTAIADGDAERAARAMQRHLESTAFLLMRYVAGQEGSEAPTEFTGRLRPFPDQS